MTTALDQPVMSMFKGNSSWQYLLAGRKLFFSPLPKSLTIKDIVNL